MTHAAPPETRRPLLALVAGVVLLALLGAVLLMASSGRRSETQAASQASPAVGDSSTLPSPLTPAETCERHVVQALARYAMAVRNGQDPDLALSAEMQSLESLEGEALLTVAYSFQVALSEPAAQSEGVAVVISRVRPGISRVCQRAG